MEGGEKEANQGGPEAGPETPLASGAPLSDQIVALIQERQKQYASEVAALLFSLREILTRAESDGVQVVVRTGNGERPLLPDPLTCTVCFKPVTVFF